jgi:AcrR family transcriptional regulator
MSEAPTTLRRVPSQARGQRRFDRVLDAAEAVFAAVGFEAATTNDIARRAETSIGSLYQFFPNKEAILQALANRYLDELRAVHDQLFDEAAVALPLPQLYDRIIEMLANFHERRPGFRPLFFCSTYSPRLAGAAAQLHQEVVQRVEKLMDRRSPGLDPQQRRILALINCEVMKGLLPLAEIGDAEFRKQIHYQIRELLLSYMRHALGPNIDGKPAGEKLVMK